MIWRKRGLVYAPEADYWWREHYAMIPTPLLLPEQNRIRVYFATTCKDKFGRITFVEVDADDPTVIVYKHDNYILDTGEMGTFDDCGVHATTVLPHNKRYYLYYAGMQKLSRSPYSLLGGLALSDDGINFERFSKVPLLERTSEELNVRSAPSVIFENGLFKMWYVAGMGWKNIEGQVHHNRLLPVYQVRHGESPDGINWIFDKSPAISLSDDEFGLGRPFIYKKDEETYQLYYSIRSASKSYRIGMAESSNARDWVRKDEEVDLDVSAIGWDSEMICYPAVIKVHGRTYMFYNGNNNGLTGFGLAELMDLNDHNRE